MTPGSFDTQWPDAPDTFSLGFVTLTGLRKWPGTFYYGVGPERLQTFRLEEPKTDGSVGSMVWLQMDTRRDPKEFSFRDSFADKVAFYRQDEKAFRMTGHKKFDLSMLAIRVPDGWTHDAFQARSGGPGRTVVHTYAGPGQSMIIRYMRPDAGIVDYARFKEINSGLTITPDTWVTLTDYLIIPSPSNLSTSALPLNDAVVTEVVAAVTRGRARIGVPAPGSSDDCQRAIQKFIEQWVTKKIPRRGVDVTDLALDLGCVWGQAVCDALGWNWREVTRGGELAYSVVSPDESCFVAPMLYMQRMLKLPPTGDVTTLLLFNMLRAGDPSDRPGKMRLFS